MRTPTYANGTTAYSKELNRWLVLHSGVQ